jgi:serine/threonine protein kinase/Tol biopolymer transport system component
VQLDPGEWERAKRIFADAVALPVDGRAAFVASACGSDARLRVEIETLLQAHEQAHLFLEVRPEIPADLFAGTQAGDAASMEGRCLGPYEFLGRAGAGGMGDVYKARDLRLNRTVAIKVLPPHLAHDRRAADRIGREARAVAVLSHPNICTLYDVGREDDIVFLVMEYLDGDTLAARLEGGPLKQAQALHFAIQIASALDRVHRAGVIHRDLKPGNIMLTKDGAGAVQAKLLDFGISELRGPAPGPETMHGALAGASSSSPDDATSGLLRGTIRYMAPEQLDGKPADARSDVFAFGAVLYEMLTGSPAFGGPTTTAVITAVHDHEPTLALPPSLQRVVLTCLAKNPDDRWQTARDLLRELQWVQSDVRDREAAVGDSRSQRHRVAWIATATGLAAAIAAAAIVFVALNRRPPEAVAASFEVSTPFSDDPMSFALSADGRQLVFVATKDGASILWVRPIDDLNARPLDGTDGASFPFWSPDARAIGYFASGKLQRIDPRGGRPQPLADAPNGRGGSWAGDGTILFAPSTAGPLMRVSSEGGTPRPATQLTPGQNSHRWPQFLSGGKRFIYLSTQGQPGTSGVFLGSLDGAAPTRVLDDDAPAVYAPPGRLLVPRNGDLVSLEFNPDHPDVSGNASVVARLVGYDTQLARGAFSVSDAGVLAYRTGIASRRQLVWFDRGGHALGTAGPPDNDAIAAPELSPDGRHVAVFRSVAGNDDVWTIPIEGGIPTRLTAAPGLDGFPIWTRDGRSVIYTALHGSYGLAERSLAGGERALFQTPGLKIATDVSPDGRVLLYAIQVPVTGVDLWAAPLPPESDLAPWPVAQTPFDEMAGQFAPNGAWIAYQSNATGQMEIYVRPFPGPGTEQRLSLGGGSQPRWSPKGQELFYVAADGRLMVIPVAYDARFRTLEAATPHALFRTHLATGANIPPAVGTKAQYVVAPDGRFLMNVSLEGAPAPPIVVSVRPGS